MYQPEIRKADVNQKAEYKMLPFLPLLLAALTFPLPALEFFLHPQHLLPLLNQTFPLKCPPQSALYTSPGIQT